MATAQDKEAKAYPERAQQSIGMWQRVYQKTRKFSKDRKEDRAAPSPDHK